MLFMSKRKRRKLKRKMIGMAFKASVIGAALLYAKGVKKGKARSKAAPATGYKKITADEAAKLIDSGMDLRIVDVRNEGYESGHIPGAISVPSNGIMNGDVGPLTDKDQTLLVYCHRGFKSKEAAQKLAELGYTDVREFGGIIDWKGEIEK